LLFLLFITPLAAALAENACLYKSDIITQLQLIKHTTQNKTRKNYYLQSQHLVKMQPECILYW